MRDLVLSFILLAGMFNYAFSASVTGVVTDQDTTPVEGVEVILSQMQGEEGDTAVSDESGEYAFSDLATGFYTIDAAAEGYTDYSDYLNVENESDTMTQDIQMTQISEENMGGLTGSVVSEETEEGIADVMIVLSSGMGFGGEDEAVDTVYSDSEGDFTIDSIVVEADAAYSITASAEGYEDATEEDIGLTGGETTSVELVLPAEVEPTGVITGNVTDSETSETLSDVMVVLSMESGFGGTAEPVDTTRTGSEGSYRFDSLEASDAYSLTAEKADYNQATVSDVSVVLDSTTTADITMEPVVMSAMSVFVGTESDEAPLASASVTASPSARDTAYNGSTDSSGILELEGLPTGDYTVTASAEGYEISSTDMELTADGDDTAYVYLPEATESQQVLSGSIQDAEGNGIEGAAIELSVSTFQYDINLTGATDESGAYDITGIPQDVLEASVSVSAEGYASVSESLTLDEGDTTVYDVTMDESSVSFYADGSKARNSLSIQVNPGRGIVIKRKGLSGVTDVAFFRADGRRIYKTSFGSSKNKVNISAERISAAGLVFAVVYNSGKIIKKQGFFLE